MNREAKAKAASPGGWGEVGMAAWPRYAKANPRARRRCPWCTMAGHSTRASHVGMTNGVALMSGCEFHVTQWVREHETTA